MCPVEIFCNDRLVGRVETDHSWGYQPLPGCALQVVGTKWGGVLRPLTDTRFFPLHSVVLLCPSFSGLRSDSSGLNRYILHLDPKCVIVFQAVSADSDTS